MPANLIAELKGALAGEDIADLKREVERELTMRRQVWKGSGPNNDRFAGAAYQARYDRMVAVGRLLGVLAPLFEEQADLFGEGS